jgi:hypothetical protein
MVQLVGAIEKLSWLSVAVLLATASTKLISFGDLSHMCLRYLQEITEFDAQLIQYEMGPCDLRARVRDRLCGVRGGAGVAIRFTARRNGTAEPRGQKA